MNNTMPVLSLSQNDYSVMQSIVGILGEQISTGDDTIPAPIGQWPLNLEKVSPEILTMDRDGIYQRANNEADRGGHPHSFLDSATYEE